MATASCTRASPPVCDRVVSASTSAAFQKLRDYQTDVSSKPFNYACLIFRKKCFRSFASFVHWLPFASYPRIFFSDDAIRPLNDPSPISVQFDEFSIYALFNCIYYIVGLHHANYIIRICYLLVSELSALLLQRLFASLLCFLFFFFVYFHSIFTVITAVYKWWNFLGFSTLLYLKFLLLWAMVILADFILEFRFEFLWPFWLLLRSVYDSFKYQGLVSNTRFEIMYIYHRWSF